jgi:1-acyl-sn-glycerol-3-phosphate acyltransferase
MNIVESMLIMSALPTKPQTEKIRPEITRLPQLTRARRIIRNFLRWFLRILLRLCTRIQVQGMENIPEEGPVLTVSNHLGDVDAIIGFAYAPRHIDAFVKADLYDFPLLGKVLDAYGVIWIHRGQPDRRAIRAALQALREGRIVTIAPEGRESLTGSLEEGTGGAAYLAWKANVPLQPATVTGTENNRVLKNLKRLRRTEVTLTVGPLFYLNEYPDRRTAINQGTRQIMRTLAAQLPPQYRGVYKLSSDAEGEESRPNIEDEINH